MATRKFADPEYVKDQYRDSSNLDARIALNERFSTATRDFHESVFDRFDFPANARILEIGCGPGMLWRRNRARIKPTWQLVLSDFSYGMARTAQSNGLPAGFLQSDAQAIPFADESFDAVIANHMLYHVPDLPHALAEIRRAIKGSGKFYAATSGLAHMREYRQLAADLLGFEPMTPIAQFTLENGAEQLRKFFARVERVEFQDSLVVTEVEPLVAYAMSGFIGQQLIGREREAELRRMIAERIARDGAIRFTKASGLFIAAKTQERNQIKNLAVKPGRSGGANITRRGVMVVVLSEDRRQVLLHRREIFFLWDLPGGGIERGEKPEQAAVRETREETGYEIEIERFVGTYTHQSVYGAGDQETKAFRGQVIGGKPKRFGVETTQLKWIDLNQLPSGLEGLHRQIIADALSDADRPFERCIEFARWKLYPARVIFTIMRFRNYFIRRL